MDMLSYTKLDKWFEVLIENKCLMKEDVEKNIKSLGTIFTKIRNLNKLKNKMLSEYKKPKDLKEKKKQYFLYFMF